MYTFFPQDSNDDPIPALPFKSLGEHSISAVASSARNSRTFAPDMKIVNL